MELYRFYTNIIMTHSKNQRDLTSRKAIAWFLIKINKGSQIFNNYKSKIQSNKKYSIFEKSKIKHRIAEVKKQFSRNAPH